MYRMAGRTAGVFAFVAILGTRALLLDASVAYGVSWAACWLLLAGFALTAERSRYGLAGIALCLAALTRLEVMVVVGGAVAIVAAATLIAPRIRHSAPRPPSLVSGRGTCRHSSDVPARLAAHRGRDVLDDSIRELLGLPHAIGQGPGALGGWLVTRYLPMIVLVALALAGVMALWQRGQAAIALGLILLIPGIVAFQFVLSIRGTYVSDRYLFLVDLALAFAAAAGFATLRVVGLSNSKLRSRVASAIALVAVVAVAMGAGGPFAPADPEVQRQVAAQRSASANLQAAEPILRATLSPSSTTLGAPPKLVVPALLSSVATVDLDLRIPDVSELRLGPDGGLDREGCGTVRSSITMRTRLRMVSRKRSLNALKRSRSVHSTLSPSPRTRRPGGGYTPSSERRDRRINSPHGRAGRTRRRSRCGIVVDWLRSSAA